MFGKLEFSQSYSYNPCFDLLELLVHKLSLENVEEAD